MSNTPQYSFLRLIILHQYHLAAIAYFYTTLLPIHSFRGVHWCSRKKILNFWKHPSINVESVTLVIVISVNGKHTIQVKRTFLNRVFGKAVEFRMPLYEKVIAQQTLSNLKIWEYSKETFTMDSVFSVVIGGRLDSSNCLKGILPRTFFCKSSETFKTGVIPNIP